MALLREAVLYGRDTGNHVGVGTSIDFAVQVFVDQGHHDIAVTLAGVLKLRLVSSAHRRPQSTTYGWRRSSVPARCSAKWRSRPPSQRGTAMSYNETIDYLLNQINATEAASFGVDQAAS